MALRAGTWQPPRQIVRGFGVHSEGGVPVWEQSSDRQNRACVEQHPERTRILFFGSSITFGVGLEAPEAFTTALEARLNEREPTPGFCVLNFAQPGFAFDQKFAVARVEVPRYKPALIMWENWIDWAAFRLIGDAAYGVSGLRVRDDGFIGVRGVPDGVNELLFLHSRLYQYLALTLGEPAVETGPQGVAAFADNRLGQVQSLAQSVGAKLVVYLTPPLDQPFSVTAANLPDWHEDILKVSRAHAIPTFLLQNELRDQDYLELRLDPCCHYSAAGHRALVPVMERIVLDQLDSNGHPG